VIFDDYRAGDQGHHHLHRHDDGAVRRFNQLGGFGY
jgi:hypothetical protein